MPDRNDALNSQPPFKRRVLIAVCALVSFFVIVFLLAWLLGAVISDRYLWSQWLLWIPTPAAILAVFVLFITALAAPTKRRRRNVIVSFFILIAVSIFFLCIEHRFHRFGSLNETGLRIVHWNAYQPGEDRPKIGAQAVVDFAGDIVVLTHAGRIPSEPVVGDWLTEFVLPHRRYPFTVLTKLPVLELRPLVSAEGVSVAIIRIDTFDRFGRELVIYAVDLPSQPQQSRMDIARQVRDWIDALDPPPPAPDVVLGDFNTTRDSAALRAMFPNMRHSFNEAGRGYGATYPTQTPLYHIDHILLDDDWRALTYELRNADVSRHLMQSAEIAPR